MCSDRDFGPFMRGMAAAQISDHIEVILIIASSDDDAGFDTALVRAHRGE
jgi:hypothetical protein